MSKRWIKRGLSVVLGAALVVGGCADDDEPMDEAMTSGGSEETGGSDATGGASETGGMAETGGSDATGGTNETGGADVTGGAMEDPDSGMDEVMDVTVSFAAMVGTEPFACDGTYTGMGTTDATIHPLDFRMYVQDLRLVMGDGTEVPVELMQDGVWQQANVALLDFEDNSGTCENGTPATNTEMVGTVPMGDYVGMAFEIGVPEELNHKNAAEAAPPLDNTGLWWNWNGGYKFARLDFYAEPETAGGPTISYNFHLGSTMCMGDAMMGEEVSCSHENRIRVRFAEFDPAMEKVIFDYAKMVEVDDMKVDRGGKGGCMSFPMDPECGDLFGQIGINYETGELDDSQVVFTKANK